jgi:hypothetical protein
VDYRSTCITLRECLDTVRDWSRQHPTHLPIFILIETKQVAEKSVIPLTVPLRFTPKLFDALDTEIRSVFNPDQMVVPDDVRGSHKTLEDAVLKDGWPSLDEARGKMVFLMDRREVSFPYSKGHPSLRKRVLFTNSDPGDPDAAFIERNDARPDTIAELVRKGYLVRTRTDADTTEPRANDTRRRDAAMASGAQILSTDYPASEPAPWTGYKVGFEGGAAARCNPVLKPAGCIDGQLEPD